MAVTAENKPNLYFSQIASTLPELAIVHATTLKKEFELPTIGVEFIPLRYNSGFLLATMAAVAGIETAVAGTTTATQGDFAKDLHQFEHDPDTRSEIWKNRIAIGSQSEPNITRVFGNHLQIALTLEASYLAMHAEPTAYLKQHNQLHRWTHSNVLYVRKNGWGPLDQRFSALSWDIDEIARFVQEKQEEGANIGTLLASDTALRTGLTLPQEEKRYDLQRAYSVLKPCVIQIADYHTIGKKEKLVPGKGQFKDELANLIQHSSSINPRTIYTVEVGSINDVRETFGFISDNYRG